MSKDKLPFRLHPEVDREAIAATKWITEDDPYQGSLFKDALTNAIRKAQEQWTIYRVFDGEYRKIRVGKFTYAIIFRVQNEEIQILAVMHLHRKPGYLEGAIGNLV